MLIQDLIKKAHGKKRKVGICGQAPSDYPEFAAFLIKEGIDSISLNPDSIIGTILKLSGSLVNVDSNDAACELRRVAAP